MVNFSGSKPASKSSTIKSAVVSLLATLGTVAALFKTGAPPEVLYTGIGTALISIFGDLGAIWGRKKAIKTIE